MEAKLKSRDYPYDGESAAKAKCKCSGGIVILSGAYGWWEYKRNPRASGGKIQEENGIGKDFFVPYKGRWIRIYIYRYVFKNLDLSSMVSIYLEYFLKYIAPAPILALRVRKAKG